VSSKARWREEPEGQRERARMRERGRKNKRRVANVCVCVCVSERAGQRHARSRTDERIRASAYESAGLKTAVAETSTKRPTCGRVKCPPRETAARKRERVFVFPHRTQSPTINGDCHGGYCSRASDSPRARIHRAGHKVLEKSDARDSKLRVERRRIF